MRKFTGACCVWWLIYMHCMNQAASFPAWLKIALVLIAILTFYKELRSLGQ